VYDALQNAFKEQPLPSLNEIARRLGYASSLPLKYRFPDLCLLLVSRSFRAKTALENALAEPIPSSLDQIAKSLGYAQESPLRTKYPELCAKVVARRKEFRTQQRDQIRNSLESMLIEDPPLTLNETARRLGYKTFRDSKPLLLRHFPELCEAIKARYHGHRKLKLHRLALHLNDALCEDPPPSLKQVVSRSAYSSSYISVSFPIQREAIKGRYRQFKKRLAAQQKAAAKSRIRQIASDLHAVGTYPAPREIVNICNGTIGMTTAELTMVLREVRLEHGLKGSR
jgi:AraC-like DNA-binding protein